MTSHSLAEMSDRIQQPQPTDRDAEQRDSAKVVVGASDREWDRTAAADKARVGAVSYLNTKPLIYGWSRMVPDASLSLDLPSRLATQLDQGELDVALIPSVEFLRSRDSVIVSDACIACRGPVRSVRLLFRVPPSNVRRLALDEGSRTSAALAQVLLHQRYGLRPELVPLPIDADFNQAAADAIVLIGDRAMELDQSPFVEVWDLGEQWNQETGLPFVFAMWVARQTPPAGMSTMLAKCRDTGLERLDEIVRDEAPRYGLPSDDCRRYFTDQLYFYLGTRELEGLELFRQQTVRLGLVPETSNSLSLQPL